MTAQIPPRRARSRLLPISAYQRMMIRAAADPDIPADYHMLLTPRLGFRITPHASPRALRHAFDKLVARHSSLRLRFVRDGGDWKAEVLPDHPVGLIIEDLTKLPPQAQQAAILEKANRPMTAFSEALFETRLMRCGAGGDVILTRAHHSIVDGYSFALIIEDLLKFVLNMPVARPAMTHEEFITLQQQKAARQQQETETFWRDHLTPLPEEPDIGRIAKGLPLPCAQHCGPIHKRIDILDPAQSGQLAGRVRQTGVSAFCYLYAAFGETLCAMAGQKEILIESALGRQDARLASFVGAAMQDVLLRFTQGGGDLEDSARRVQDSLATATRALPTDLFYANDSWVASEIHKGQTHSQRFVVHTFVPTGKIDASPFSKLFSGAMESKVSIGFVSLQALPLHYEVGFAELFLSVLKTPAGPNASLSALQDAFTPAELDRVVDGMKDRLEV